MAYVGAAFGSANADVRGAALRVAVAAADAAGAVPVRRLLPQGMNPKMKEQVEHALGLDSSAPQPAGGRRQSCMTHMVRYVQDGAYTRFACSPRALMCMIQQTSIGVCATGYNML